MLDSIARCFFVELVYRRNSQANCSFLLFERPISSCFERLITALSFFLVDLESISRDLPYEGHVEESSDFLRELRGLFLESRAIQCD